MHALAAVRREIGSHDRAPKSKYLREFADAFRRYDTVFSAEELEHRIIGSDLILIGDYHALAASQRFAASVVERSAQKRPVVLGVEAILSRDQKILDTWWRREMPQEELRRRLRFDRDWGYPWEPFYGLLCAARDYSEGIYGLDCMPREDMRRIHSRDRHAAVKITEIRKQHPTAAILVLFGESHMAPQHLPRAVDDLLPNEKWLAILQNIDALYWQATNEQCPALQHGAVGIGDQAVCVFNSSPLEKYEGYRLCLDRWNAATSDDQQDFAPAVYNLVFSLARSLGFQLDSPSNRTQPKFLADSIPEVISIGPDSPSPELDQKSCLYLPESNSFLIREFQMAEAAEECTRFLHLACRGMAKAFPSARPIETALARFGARLLLPGVNSQITTPTLGDSLYHKYLAGEISQSCIQHLFLTHVETAEQAETALNHLTTLARSS
ncbi:MAG TPA: ChaN family lipoprotein [Terriglobales bacterium]|nr:ChaN family lipoprotein [Terriglobales bacterium]